tara:strand:- start:964 stop:1275 length:312 start_codon:yes stop_codon:yes gene_type:complete
MKTKFLSSILLSLVCCACSNTNSSGNKRAVEINENQEITSQLSLIEASFKKGDMKTACRLQLSLSNKINNYVEISPDLLNELNKAQIKCGVRSLSIDLNKNRQ